MNNYPSLRKILRDALNDILEEGSDPTIRVRPSTLGSCKRKIVLSIIEGVEAEDDEVGQEDNWGGVGRGAMVVGKIYERALLPYFTQERFKYQCYILIDKEINLYGHCDFYLPPDENREEAIIVDLKTTGKKSIPFLPQRHHLNQILLYMHGALHGEIWETDEKGMPVKQLENPKKICGALLYVIRDDPYIVFDTQEYWVEYVEEGARALINYTKELNIMVQNREIPNIPPSFNPFSYPCYYASDFGEVRCIFWDKCWSGRLAKKGEEMEEFAKEIIAKYNEYRRAKERYESARDTLKDMLKDYPSYEIMTDEGSVSKTVEFRQYVNYKGILQNLVEEGFISQLELRKIIDRHTKETEVVTIRIRPKGA